MELQEACKTWPDELLAERLQELLLQDPNHMTNRYHAQWCSDKKCLRAEILHRKTSKKPSSASMPGFGLSLSSLDDETLVKQHAWLERRITEAIHDDGPNMLTRYLGLTARRTLVESEVRARRYVRYDASLSSGQKV